VPGWIFGDQEKLAAAGGNSSAPGARKTDDRFLDQAQKNGLYVTLGLDVARERHGFDYSNSNSVARQLGGDPGQVIQFKDHPHC